MMRDPLVPVRVRTGTKGGGFSNDLLVPVPEPGLKAPYEPGQMTLFLLVCAAVLQSKVQQPTYPHWLVKTIPC